MKEKTEEKKKAYLPVQIHLTLNPENDEEYKLIDRLSKMQIEYGTLGVSYARIAKFLMIAGMGK